MNERIKELYDQCFVVLEHDTPNTGFQIEKFTELIVKECLSIVKSNTYGPAGEFDYSYSSEDSAADARAETIYKEISYRFGVD
jgi:hypothetical protein